MGSNGPRQTNGRWTRRRVLGGGLRLATLAGLGGGGMLLAGCEAGRGPVLSTRRSVPVALLVPYGAADPGVEMIARHLENAARLAVRDLEGVEIDLRVYPTAGTPEMAADAARRAAGEGARAIVGPLFAEAARAAADAVASRSIPVLAFSNDTEVAGGNLFLLGDTFDNRGRRILSFAARQGRDRVIVVHEDTRSGNAAAAAVRRVATEAGAEIVAVASFPFSQQGLIDALPEIAGTARQSGANAVLLTSDAAGALPLVGQLLPENGIAPPAFQYLGLTRWDVPAQTLSIPGLRGGWFVLPDPNPTAAFAARFQEAYGEPPHTVAGLAYDGIAAIGALVRAGAPLGPEGLTQPNGFVGTGGIFRFRPDGTAERALAVAEAEQGSYRIIDPAPTSFAGAGY